MKIASWNVNSLRVRLGHVLEWIQTEDPDVLGLQELKMPSDDFPLDEFDKAGYHSAVNGQKTYNGVALVSRSEPLDIIDALPDFADEQRRVIAATYGDTRVINLYVPNGQSIDSDKYAYKLEWLDALRNLLQQELENNKRLAVMGDFNIAPDDRDVHDPEEWYGKVLCSEPERAKLAAICELGLNDSFRLFEQPDNVFSWWDYRAAAFRRKRGLRIDLVLLSNEAAEDCVASRVDVEPRKWERPSDHAPVVAELK